MQFGKVEQLSGIDFSLPEHTDSSMALLRLKRGEVQPAISVGCNTWNRQQLKDFYPKGTKDELTHYASQFNAIEFNASFYRNFPEHQVVKWREKASDGFRFFPKVFQGISHWKRLNNAERMVDEFIYSIENFEDKLGTCFVQMNENFAPSAQSLTTVANFLSYWPSHIPLALEVRHTHWHNDATFANEYYSILESYNVSNIITDTAGRRDLVHMQLTSSQAFVRFVGANHSSDYTRVQSWVSRVQQWLDAGLQQLNFFVHQHHETESPKIAKQFIEALNKGLEHKVQVPNLVQPIQKSLF